MLKRNNSIEFRSASQIINMGGPYIADLYFDENLIFENVLADNFILKNELLIFSIYHNQSYWQKENFFTINVLNLESFIVETLELKLDAVYLSFLDNDFVLTYFNAFHNKDSNLERNVKINSSFTDRN
jgi:hypothetical protein